MVVPINVIVSYEAENVTNVTQFVCRKNQEVNAEKKTNSIILIYLMNFFRVLPQSFLPRDYLEF